jgi:hypothetical protein
MKILFFNGLNITPHLEREMEIATDLINEENEVYFVHCRGELQTCRLNPSHTKWICGNCSKRKMKAMNMLNINSAHILHFPKVGIPDSLIPEKFETLKDLKSFTYEGVDIGMAVASSLISLIRDHRLDTEKYQALIRKGIHTALQVHAAGKKLLDEVKPDLVILFNGRFLEIRPVMRLCEQRHIDYYTHEVGGVMNTYLIRKNTTPHAVEAIAKEILELWGDGSCEKEKTAARFFEDRRNRVMQGNIVFAKNQKQGHLPESFDASKKNIVIFNSSLDEYEGISGFENKIYADDNVGIRSIVASFKNDPNVHFYLRVHPNLSEMKNSQMKEIMRMKEEFENLTVIAPEEVIDTYAMIDAADTVVVFNSTTGAEACFWGKPVIVLGNASYAFLKGFYKPTTHAEVVRLLKQDLHVLDKSDILKYGYWQLSKGIRYKYYQPSTLVTGKFMGEEVNIPLYDKVLSLLSL